MSESGERWLFRLVNFYPPLLGAGVRVRRTGARDEAIETRMKLRWWNRNYFGTHFGGSLYTMCDPFFVLLLAQRLGRGYLVWDKAATIRFRRPGQGTVRARFEVPDARLEGIRAAADRGEVVEPVFHTQVVDEAGAVVAEVEKLLYIRAKARQEDAAGGSGTAVS